ncbi:hypothetical protein B0H13DRAFT_1921752 [Mycena leptocephala]|nr:hypothetical protein B0H13DRAFT_1921752 [Mycena leptocephala]
MCGWWKQGGNGKKEIGPGVAVSIDPASSLAFSGFLPPPSRRFVPASPLPPVRLEYLLFLVITLHAGDVLTATLLRKSWFLARSDADLSPLHLRPCLISMRAGLASVLSACLSSLFRLKRLSTRCSNNVQARRLWVSGVGAVRYGRGTQRGGDRDAETGRGEAARRRRERDSGRKVGTPNIVLIPKSSPASPLPRSSECDRFDQAYWFLAPIHMERRNVVLGG